MYCLQSRWKLMENKLVYYGLRNRENLFRNEIRLSRKQRAVIASLPRKLNDREKEILGKLLGSCVVTVENLRKIPSNIRQANFCTGCCANDFILPGLEFDEQGRCPMCQTREETKHLRSLVPVVERIPRAKRSRFDVGLFYTGGKDSTYLLYHLTKVMGLRVLAMTWEIPFMSESARASIENAKTRFPEAEFITRTVAPAELRKFYRKLYSLSENTCACPSLAYVLFYPELVANRVPYFVAGNEPAQILGLYYNHMAPKLAYTFPDNRFLNFLINAGRVLTLRPPLKRGQFHTLTTMRKLAFGGGKLQDLLGYQNELVDNVVEAIKEVPHLVEPLRRSIRYSSRTGHIPAFVQLDFDKISGGSYDWKQVKERIVRECGWVPPRDEGKALHTSCKIEKCKEYSQFVRFYHCRSRMIPFSALEISLASASRNLSREEALREMEEALGFSLTEVPECAIMKAVLEESV